MAKRVKEKIEKFEWAEFSEAQLKSIQYSNARINLWEGSVRSGKTIASIVRWLEYVKSGPRGDLLMIGKTERTLKRNILDLIQSIVGTKNYKHNKGTGELFLFGRRIYLVGANDERSENKIRGMTLAGAYGDEVTLWPKGFFQMLMTRLSVTNSKLFATTNPDSPTHWLLREYLDNPELNLKRFSFTLDDNLSLDPNYVKDLKKEFSGVFYQRFILGKWVIAEGLVYSDFDTKVHIVSNEFVDKMCSSGVFKYFIAGIDWGTTHPMSANIYGVTRNDEYYQISHYYHTNQSTEHLSNWLLAEQTRLGSNLKYLFCDSAEPDRIAVLRGSGFNAKSANKVINSGLNSVMISFKNKKLFIAERCENVIKELGLYSYPDIGDPKAKKDKPLDKDNHAMDAMRYAIHNHEIIVLRRQIRAKKKGRRPSTHSDYRRRQLVG